MSEFLNSSTQAVREGQHCGCFYCEAIYLPSEITEPSEPAKGTRGFLASLRDMRSGATRWRPRHSESRRSCSPTICGQERDGLRCRDDVSLSSPYWEEGISVAILASNRPDFGVRVEDRYASRTVCATGRCSGVRRRSRTAEAITRVEPEYTPEAQAKRREGIVLWDGVVMADGTVGDVVVVHSLDAVSGLNREAVKAFKRWRFTPGTAAGRLSAVVG